MSLVSVTAPIEIHVRSELKDRPLIELFPFRMDRASYPQYDDETDYLASQEALLVEGTSYDEWISGHVLPVKFESLKLHAEDSFLTHTPVVSPGIVSFYWDERYLPGEASVCLLASMEELTDIGYEVTLPEDVIESTIVARLFVRNEDAEALTLFRWNLTDEFTGVLEEGGRQPTIVDESIVWDAVSERHFECLLEEGTLYFSNSRHVKVGKAYEEGEAEIVESTWEYHYSASAGRTVFTKFFPIESVQVATVNGDVLTLWEEVENLNLVTDSTKAFSVNKELGIVTLGGYSNPDLILSEDLTDSSNYIPFVFAEHHSSYPSHGVIQIGSEKILYEERTSLGFSTLTRGYDSTTPASHTRGDYISDASRGAVADGELYLSYTAVPRVDFEVAESNKLARNGQRLDVKSTVSPSPSGVLQVGTKIKSVASLVLTSDSPLIGGNVYGPIYFGTDVSRLTATALDRSGNPVDEVEVTIEVVSGVGYLSDDLGATSGFTNAEGEFYADYRSPIDSVESSYSVMSITHEGGDTVIRTESIAGSLRNEKFWLFQILKCDPVYGTVGVKATTKLAGSTNVLSATHSIYIDGIFGEEFNGGYLDVLKTNLVKQRFTVLRIDQEVIDGRAVSLAHLVEPVSSGQIINRPCWLLQEGAVSYDAENPNGLMRLVYEWSEDAVHPITEEAGAYMPVFPDTISASALTYESKSLPIPAPGTDTNNLAAYRVVGPREALLRASVTDPLTGQTIYSNELRLKVLIGPSLIGVDFSGELPIPYGLRLYTEEHNNGVAIGGANFYTINPEAVGALQLPLAGVI